MANNVITSMTTYTGKQSEFKDLVMIKLYGYLGLRDLGFQVIEDVQSNKIMYKDALLDKITKKRVGCNNTATGTGVAISSFTLSVVDIQTQLEQCSDVFDATIAETVRKKGVDINDLTGTEIESYILEKVAETAARDLYRIVFLGDTTLSDSNYTPFDGIYKKVKAGYLAGDGTTYGGAITSSSLSISNIVATLDAVWDAQSYELKFIPDEQKVMFVEDSVFRAWEKYLSSTQFSGVGEQRNVLVNGVATLSFRGIPMVNTQVISKYLALDFATGSPAAVANPYRILLTKADNHYIVTDAITDTAKVVMWYEPLQDTNYTRLRYKAGYNYAYGALNCFAGF
jgi:hypothetical protein